MKRWLTGLFVLMIGIASVVAKENINGETVNSEVVDAEIKPFLEKPFVKVNFKKTRQLKILSRPFVTHGNIVFIPNKGLVWHTTKPIQDILLIGYNGVSQLKTPQDEPVKIDNPVIESASHVFISIFSLELDRIKASFDLKKLNPENGLTRYQLQAKDENIRKVIGRIIISGKDRVEHIFIEEHSGDTTQVDLTDHKNEKSVLTDVDNRLLGMM